MAIEIDDALRRLGGLGQATREAIADLLLVHDRPIVRPVDDSVARFGPDGLQVLRRARGFAPLPIKLNFAAATILAVGGHLKNTVALAVGGRQPASVVLSQHIGDLESALSLNVFRRAIDDLLEFFAAKPQAVACDLHPDYASTRYAEELAAQIQRSSRSRATSSRPRGRLHGGARYGRSRVGARLGRHGLWPRRHDLGRRSPRLPAAPITVAWLTCGPSRCPAAIGRHASRGGRHWGCCTRSWGLGLSEGDRSKTSPTARQVENLSDLTGQWFSTAEQQALAAMLARGLNCPRTSSMGRLFDAVAALCGLGQDITFEGQAAMKLEFAAEAAITESYSIPLQASRERMAIADWEPMIRQILDERRRANRSAGSVPASTMAWPNSPSSWPARPIATRSCSPAAASRICLLTERVRMRLLEGGFKVIRISEFRPATAGSPWDKSSSPRNKGKDRSMCLGIPGKVAETYLQNDLPMGKVEFGGIRKEFAWPTCPRPSSATMSSSTSVLPSAASTRRKPRKSSAI